MGNRAKNHHIVPKALQKHFAIEDDDQRIWRAKKGRDGKFLPPERKRFEKALYIKDYYTVLDNDERSDRIERQFYAHIDDYLGRLLPDVINSLRDGNAPDFTDDGLTALRELAIQMAKRTPDFLGGSDDIELGKKFINSLHDSPVYKANPEEREKLTTELSDEKRLMELGRDIRVKGTIQHSERLHNVLKEFSPKWSISQTKHSYILSSRMIYFIGNGGRGGLLNRSCELWMPIEPKISLVLVRDPEFRIPQVVVDTPKHIREVNQMAARQSFEVASHSKRLLDSLTGY